MQISTVGNPCGIKWVSEMSTREQLVDLLKQVNNLVMYSNKQLEAYRLLHDSAVLIGDHKSADNHRMMMHTTMDHSLDHTAEQMRLIKMINQLGKPNE